MQDSSIGFDGQESDDLLAYLACVGTHIHPMQHLLAQTTMMIPMLEILQLLARASECLTHQKDSIFLKHAL